MGLPINYRLWQPQTSLGFNTDLMAGFDGLQPSQNLGLDFNPGQVSTPKFGGKLNSALGIAGGIASGLVDLYQGINADTSNIENAVDQQVDALGNIKYTNATSMDDLMNKQSSYRGLKANHKASEFYQGPSTGGIFANALSKGASAAMSASSTSPIGMAIAGGLSFAGSLAGGLIGRNKQQKVADSETARLNAEERRKNAFMEASYRTDADNLVTKNNRNLMSQIAAYGGPLGISLNPVHGAIDFMQNEELLDSLEGDTTKTNRKTSLPEFAFGGALGGYGGDWSNGLTFIKAGGTHGQNPLGGVPAGIAQDGMPNLVEEGEAIWNDYVFSNRLKVPKRVLEKYKFGGDSGLTFAQAVEKAQKNSVERPNDLIEKRGLESILTDLMQEQEAIRQMKAQREQYKQLENEAAFAADGGPIHIAKNKRGTFTAAATKHGMGVQEFASKVLANKDNYSPAMVKKANFARNASKWSHALGGHLFWPGGPKGELITPLTDWANSDYYLGNSPMDAYVPIHTDYSKPWDVWDTQTYFGQDPLVITPKASRPKSTIQPKPFAQSPIKQNPTPIYLSDDSEMNRYVAATNPLAIHNLTIPNNLGFKYNGLGTTYNTTDATSTTNNNNGQRDLLPTSGWQTGLRYIPILGNSLGLAHSLFNKPDYSYADELSNLAANYENQVSGIDVQPTYLGDYLAYNPFDRIFYANELGAQQAGANRLIGDMGNGNYGRTMASLLASNYNNNVAMGKLFREGDEYNLNQRHKVAEFNRGTNQFNAEADLKAQLAKAEAKKAAATVGFEGKAKALAMKQAIDQAREQAIMANATGLFQGLGDIGWEAKQAYWNNALINSGYYGTPNEYMYDIAYGRRHAAKGGKLNRKKKKGLTI